MENVNERVYCLMTLGKIKSISNPNPIIEKKNEKQYEDFTEARKFFEQNLFASFVCMLSGLYCIMFIPSIVKVLHSTGQSSDPKKAFKR